MANDDDKRHMKRIHEDIPDDIKTLLEENSKSKVALSESLHKLTEMLDYLRIIVKYQTFDLEATNRELAYYKNKCEQAGDSNDDRK